MNIKACAPALLALLTVTAAPVLAQSTNAAPVRLDRVQIAQSYGIHNNFDPGLVSIAFTNTANVPATGVVFDLLGYQGVLIAQYNDLGTFRPGETLRHRFPDIHEDPDQQIQVGRVTFADGTVWEAKTHGATTSFLLPGY